VERELARIAGAAHGLVTHQQMLDSPPCSRAVAVRCCADAPPPICTGW
jgi:hypothetical protein